MKKILLFKWLVPRMSDTPVVSWSLKDWCGADFSEMLESKEFIIPDGFYVAEDMCGTPHFYGKMPGSNHETWFDVETNQKNEKPFLDVYPERLYLKEVKGE